MATVIMRLPKFPILRFLLVISVFSITSYATDQPDLHALDDGHKFVTRPDIEAPRFNVQVYDRRRVSRGYWFVPSYDFLDQSAQRGGRWTAPHIFDNRGDLIWSGAYLSQKYDAFDFRMSKVLGEDMLSFIYPKNRSAIILDTNFNIRHVIPVAERRQGVDMHEFHFVDNGTRALFFYDEQKKVTREHSRSIGYMKGNCSINDNLFMELDVEHGFKPVFTWSAANNIGLHESSDVETPLEGRCAENWDFLHVNSLDKFPDGSYLMSSRHADTIYKIAPDGTIAWRFGGVMSDFKHNFDFSRQHHARVLSSDEKHTTISFFDNALKTPLKASTSDSSRGLIVQLNTHMRPMTAKLVHQYAHPDGPGSYVIARANIQILPNGNVWICWVDGLHSSEHAPDGTLVMEARVKQEWLKAYRTYKFNFVGRPSDPPDVLSRVIGLDKDNSTQTLVHVSWNGATEVRTWKLYKTDDRGNTDNPAPVAILPRMGFETALSYKGFATFVVIEAFDRHGSFLGRSEVVKTLVSAKMSPLTIADESLWLEMMRKRADAIRQAIWLITVIYENPSISFSSGLLCGITIVLAMRAFWQARRKGYFTRRRGDSIYICVAQGEESEKISTA